MTIDISLYGIIDPDHCGNRDPGVLADEAIRAGITLIQLRDKGDNVRRMVEFGRRIVNSVDGRVPVLINDRADVAQVCNAQGVHLGQNDLSVHDARQILGPDAKIGLSIKTEDDAVSAPLAILDYVCIGGVFETKSKQNPTSIGVAGWQMLAQLIRSRAKRKIPVGAIAGITPERAIDLRAAGADGVAVISAIFEADDVFSAVEDFKNAWQGAPWSREEVA